MTSLTRRALFFAISVLAVWCRGAGSVAIEMMHLLNKCNSVYVGDSNRRMKMKLNHLERELVLEAVRNVQRVKHFKPYYTIFTEYDIGTLLFRIRSKFARMVRLFLISHDNLHKENHNKHIRHLTEIQQLAMDIYTLVEMLEDWEENSKKRKGKNLKLPAGFTPPANFSELLQKKMTNMKNKLRMGRMTTNSWTKSIKLHNKKPVKSDHDHYEGFDSDY